MSQATAVSHGVPEASKAGSMPLRASIGVRAMFGILMMIGAAAFLIEVRGDPTRAYAAFLIGYFFTLGLALFGALFTAIHHLVGATWSVVVRRVAESFTSYFPVAFFLFFVLLLGVPNLYVWSTTGVMAHGVDAEHLTKGGWLTPSAFAFRGLVALALWSLFSWYFVRNSTRQDQTRDPRLTRSSAKAAAIFVPIFAITLTIASFDMLMSLEPLWFSTMFGVYCFAGLWQAGLATLTIVVVLMRRQGALQGIVNKIHYHDLGKYLISFSVFWMYIAFSQFMLIWYADIPEETIWYSHRIETDWAPLSIVLLFGHFIIPFVMLMSRDTKRRLHLLAGFAVWMLVMHFGDLFWLVMPEYDQHEFTFHAMDVFAFLGIGGLFIAWAAWRGSGVNLIPIRDPKLGKSIGFENY
jgi:hypothetical protein